MNDIPMSTADYESIDPFELKAPYFICMEHLARYIYAAYIFKRKRVSNVLDIACGTGYGSREFALEVMHATGVDYDERNIEKAKSDYSVDGLTRFIAGNIDARDYLHDLNGTLFDGIACFETLEHIQDPKGFLLDLNSILSKQGCLILSVPDGKFEPVDADGKLKSTFHRHLFSEDSLETLVDEAGFKVEKMMYQPDSAGLHRNENRAIRDLGMTREQALSAYNTSPEDLRFLSQIYAWPRRNKGMSYNILFVCSKQ